MGGQKIYEKFGATFFGSFFSQLETKTGKKVGQGNSSFLMRNFFFFLVPHEESKTEKNAKHSNIVYSTSKQKYNSSLYFSITVFKNQNSGIWGMSQQLMTKVHTTIFFFDQTILCMYCILIIDYGQSQRDTFKENFRLTPHTSETFPNNCSANHTY